MDLETDFTCIFLLLKLEDLIQKRNKIKSALKNEILLFKNNEEQLGDSLLKENYSKVNSVEGIKTIYKRSDLMAIPCMLPPYREPDCNKEPVVRVANRNEQCYICGVVISRYNMEFHINAHFKRKPYKCNINNCKQSFASRSSLYCHKRHHTNIKPYSCDICSAKFHFKSYLKKHKIIHLEPTYECTVCNQKHKSSLRLKYHMKAHENENLSCSISTCTRKFRNRRSLRVHLRKCHSIRVRERIVKQN